MISAAITLRPRFRRGFVQIHARKVFDLGWHRIFCSQEFLDCPPLIVLIRADERD